MHTGISENSPARNVKSPQGPTLSTCPSPRLSAGLLGLHSEGSPIPLRWLLIHSRAERQRCQLSDPGGQREGISLPPSPAFFHHGSGETDPHSASEETERWSERPGDTQLRGPKPEPEPATATGARSWPCSPALSSLPNKPVGRQQSKDLRWNFSAPAHLPAEASEDPSPGASGQTLTALPLGEQRFWFCSLLAGSSMEGGESRRIWGVDEGEREGEKERDRREERQAIYLPAKSGFSMETKVPVCLKMPLKKKIVNHFPPRRQRWLPGFDSWIWKTFLSIIPMPAPT